MFTGDTVTDKPDGQTHFLPSATARVGRCLAPDRTIHNPRATNAVNRRILCLSEMQIDRL